MSAVLRSSSVTTGQNAAGTVVINKPSGTVDGDLLVAVITLTFNSGSQSMTPPSGWTLIRNTSAGGGGAPFNIFSYYKVASSEGSSWTWTVSGALSTWGGCSVIRIDNQNTVTPILTSNGDGTNSASTTSLTFADTVTPTSGYHLILFPIVANGVGLGTVSNQAIVTDNPTWTELYDDNGASNVSSSLAYTTRDQSTATGDSSATASASCVSFVGQLIVVNRLYDFSATITDTTTATDNTTNNVAFTFLTTDTTTSTDLVVSEKARVWKTPQKNIATWLNQDKS